MFLQFNTTQMLYPGFVQPEPAAEDTCILIPQMYGGRTNAEQLRNIANIIEAYSIPDVSITHSQRLKLSGIKSADLPNIKKDLKMPVSTNELRHTLQSIKACTCGQNRLIQQLAAQIERHLETLPFPLPFLSAYHVKQTAPMPPCRMSARFGHKLAGTYTSAASGEPMPVPEPCFA